jgi:hypothetical protein
MACRVCISPTDSIKTHTNRARSTTPVASSLRELTPISLASDASRSMPDSCVCSLHTSHSEREPDKEEAGDQVVANTNQSIPDETSLPPRTLSDSLYSKSPTSAKQRLNASQTTEHRLSTHHTFACSVQDISLREPCLVTSQHLHVAFHSPDAGFWTAYASPSDRPNVLLLVVCCDWLWHVHSLLYIVRSRHRR